MATKKTLKKKPAAKAKPSAKKPAKKQAKPAKKAKKPAAKSAKKPVKKAAKPAKKATKPAKKNTKSKPVAKKKVTPKKKVSAKAKPAAKKKTNTIKKAAVKKPSKKVVKKIVKKVAKKVVKKAAPKKKVVKPIKAIKKPVLKKPAKPVKPAKPAKVKPEPKLKVVKPVPAVKEKTQKKLDSENQKIKEKAGRKKKKLSGDEDEPKMEDFDPIVEELMASKKKGKIPKVPKIPSPIKLIPTVKIEAVEKEHVIPVKNFRSGGKEKFEMEFFIKSSPRILYNFISSPSGLSEWFSDDVNIKNGVYTFFWEDSEEKALLLATKEFEYMRFKWNNTDEDDTYFEMKIKIDELTGDVALIITDFAKKEELGDVQRLWEAQIHDLCKALGS